MQAGTPKADLWIPGVCEDAGAVSKTHDHSQQPVHAAKQRMSARQCHQLRGERKHLAHGDIVSPEVAGCATPSTQRDF